MIKKYFHWLFRAHTLSIALVLHGCSYHYQPIDWEHPPTPHSDNYYFICASKACGPNAEEAQSYPISPENLYQIIQTVILKQPRVEMVENNPKKKTLVFVQRTPRLRFPDIIQMQIISTPSGQASYLWYSKAVYGYYDFNVNKDRLQLWAKLVDHAVEKHIREKTKN